MPYRQKNATLNSRTVYPEPISFSNDESNQGFDILARLLSSQAREALGLPVLASKDSSWTDEGNILYSRPSSTTSHRYKRVKLTLEELQSILTKCTYSDLRAAIAKNPSEYRPLPYDIDKGYIGSESSKE